MKKPLVSICCITYNHKNFISDAIEGFLMQKTNFDFEIIIHDDASQDGTSEVIKVYEEKYPQIIKAIYQVENQYSKGKRPSLNFVWPKAIGKYLAFCEGDDYWIDPFKLQKQVDFLEANQEFIMCFTNGVVVNDLKEIVKEKQISGTIEKDIFSIEDMPLFAPTHTRLLRKFDFNQLPEVFSIIKGGDTFLTAWLAQIGKIKYLDFVSSAYRVHSGGIYSSLDEFDDLFQLLETRISILENIKIDKNQKLCNDIINYFNAAGNFITNKERLGRFNRFFAHTFSNLNSKYKILMTKIYIKKIIKYKINSFK